MNNPLFKPKTDLKDYLNDGFNHEIYCALTDSSIWKDVFKPLDYLNLLYERFYIVQSNLTRPYDQIEHLRSLDLTKKQYFFLLDGLLHLLYNNITFLANPFNKNLLAGGGQSYQIMNSLHSQEVKSKAKIAGINEFQDGINRHINVYDFIEKERDKIYKANETSVGTPVNNLTTNDNKKTHEVLPSEKANSLIVEEKLPSLKLSHRGVKTDVLRIFNALYELNLLKTSTGNTPTKKEFMYLLGRFLGTDYSSYSQQLEGALTVDLKKHLAIFDKLKENAEAQWEEKNKIDGSEDR
ncbi:hypothetical protein GCM10027592_63440 [Spirosoma flavus]